MREREREPLLAGTQKLPVTHTTYNTLLMFEQYLPPELGTDKGMVDKDVKWNQE